ncbi:MAG: zinc-binding dehydrogenase [Deltaproteobacteria bacterium]|nr:zinc-binding dehydrogenase [Deltaproteobacteria bacterium]
MKALHFYHHGGLDNLTYGDVDDPTPGPGEVIIRVRACSLNHLDLWVLRGWPGLNLPMPHIGGADIAGEIHAVGPGVTGLKEGAEVIVNPGVVTVDDEYTARGEDSLSPGYKLFGEGMRGGFASFVAVPAKNVHPLIDGFSFVEASALLLVGLTSWRMLRHRAKLQAGETVLVIGAGGGVNSFSIQLAKALGAEVIALTSSADKAERATALGAKSVINYRETPDWSREVRRMTGGRGVEVVIDNVGAHTFAQSLNSACRGGRIVTVGNTSGPNVTFDNRLMFTKQLTLLGSTMGGAKDFADMIAFVKSQNMKPIVDQTIALKDGKSAYRLLEEGKQFGKIVLCP